jgi:hypothetical protein
MKLSVLILASAFAATASAQAKKETFTGEIADSSCAYNVHSLSRSHKEMQKSKEWGTTAADCTRRCVQKFGASYVLVHKNDVYRLAEQDLAEKFAGQQVKIEGILEDPSKPIHIESIEPLK